MKFHLLTLEAFFFSVKFSGHLESLWTSTHTLSLCWVRAEAEAKLQKLHIIFFVLRECEKRRKGKWKKMRSKAEGENQFIILNWQRSQAAHQQHPCSRNNRVQETKINFFFSLFHIFSSRAYVLAGARDFSGFTLALRGLLLTYIM